MLSFGGGPRSITSSLTPPTDENPELQLPPPHNGVLDTQLCLQSDLKGVYGRSHQTVQSLIRYVKLHVAATSLGSMSRSSVMPSSSHKWSISVVKRNSWVLQILRTRLDSNLSLLWSYQKQVESKTTHKTLNCCDLNNSSAHYVPL